MISRIKSHTKAVIIWLSDSAHRRGLATMIALLSTHALGYILDATTVATYLEIGIGMFAGAWSSRTPNLTPEAGDVS